MPIDSRFIITSDLEEFFVDKDSGEPLSAGVVTFYSDNDRSTKKAVYQITSPSVGNYTYTALPNPLTLSDVGGWVDAQGNSIVPYYFPYECDVNGDYTTSTGEIELYYITIYSDGGVLQATRVGWPNFSSQDVNGLGDLKNFIPNGQFLIHNDGDAAVVESAVAGYSSAGNVDITHIAQGGWEFVRSSGGTSTFDNTFIRQTTGIGGIDDFPRYVWNFKCTSFNASDQVRDLFIKFPDVYKFSAGNPVGSQQYTHFFAGQSNAGTVVFDVRLIQSFGTGGSPSSPIDTSIGSITFTPSESYLKLTGIVFPGNSGSLGTGNDDYCGIAIRGPSSGWDISVTDFALLLGDVSPEFFPESTNSEMQALSVAGWKDVPPLADGSQFYLPMVMTAQGMTFDDSDVGSIVASVKVTGASANELICDGAGYLRENHSSVGIPYQRLFDKLYSSTYKAPIFGTGYNFFDSYLSLTDSTSIRLSTNKAGVQTLSADISTTFTVITMRAGQVSANVTARMESSSVVSVKGNFKGAVTAPGAGTSGLTITSVTNNASRYQYFNVTVGAAPAAGTYFIFRSSANNSGGTNDSYYVWFQVDEVGADPAPGGTGIKVDIKSTWNTSEVAQAIKEGILCAQTTYITTVAEAAIPQSSYFSVYANAQQYVIWMNKNGGGVEPVVGGAIYIPVAVATGDTAAIIASNTLVAMNSISVGVPDARGLFLRGLDDASSPSWDLNIATRLSTLSNVTGGIIGSLEYDEIYSHSHTADSVNGTGVGIIASAAGPAGATVSTNLTGGAESRPANMAVNYYIKY